MITWIASYPRCGNTLLRTILHDVFGVVTVDRYCLYDYVAKHGQGVVDRCGFSGGKSIEEMRKSSERHFVKTHGTPEDDSPVLYAVRDPRCALISYSYYTRNRGEPWYEPSELLKREEASVAWHHHVAAWIPRNPLVLRYEDMVGDPGSVIVKIAAYCGLTPLRPWKNPFGELHGMDTQFFRSASDTESLKEFNALPDDVKGAFWKTHGEWMAHLGYPSTEVRI